MSRKIVSNVRAHNDKMFKLSEKNRETPAFNVRQFTNPFMLASTQSLLTQLVAKSGGGAAVPTTSASMGTVSEPFVETTTTKEEAAPLAAESTAAEATAETFEIAQERAKLAEEARHAAHQAYKENKKEYAKESATELATLPNGWSLTNTPEQYATKLAENTAAYKKSQVDGIIDMMDEMQKPSKYTGTTRASKAPAKYKMLEDTLKLAEAHLKVMQQHNKDQVTAYKRTYSRFASRDKVKRAEAKRLHKIYQDAHRMSRDDYAASYKAQKAAANIIRAKVATAKLNAGTEAAKAATSASKTSRSSADAKAAAATAKAIPDSADFKVIQGNMKAQKDFVTALNEYKNQMSDLAKAQKPSTAKESKQQLERDAAGLMAIRKELGNSEIAYKQHMITDFKANEEGAYTKDRLAQYNALSESEKSEVRPAIQKYTKLRGDLIQFDANNEENKKLPPIDLTGKSYAQRRAALKKAADAHLKYLTWYSAHHKLYQSVYNARAAARASLKKQVLAAAKATVAERGAATIAETKAKAAPEAKAADLATNPLAEPGGV